MGTLYTCSLSTMGKFEHIKTKFFIVLRPGKVKVNGMLHRPDLAPSKDLFLWTQQNKHNEGWFTEYARRYREEMIEHRGLREAIDELEVMLHTKDVLLVCFCPLPNVCHRSLIAEELANRGFPTVVQ